MWLVYLAFFLSGFPALIYQLLWQRSLFTIYGVNIESITVVVAAFMAGLGLGSLLGGAISTIRWVEPLVAFAVFELSIGAFGLLSPKLFEVVGARTLGASTVGTFFITFGLVLFPTLLMGATLPLLVSHLVRRFRNVGASVGVLYFVNTLGAAGVCFVAVVWMFGGLGRSGSLGIAAGINLFVGSAALVAYWLARGKASGTTTEAVDVAELSASGPSTAGAGKAFMGFPIALLAVGTTGYISLSYEILWVRMYSFLLSGAAAAFPLLLGAFLTGIAFGSWMAGRYCRRIVQFEMPRHRRSLAYFVLLAGVCAYLVIPAMARVSTWTSLGFAVSLLFVALGAALLGAMLPLMSHFSLGADRRVGVGLGYLYLANIVGAAAGTLITGFVLMEHWRAGTIAVFTALLGVGLSAALLLGGSWSWQRGRDLAGLALVAGAVVLSGSPLFDQLYERLLYKVGFTAEKRFVKIVENRSGVITVTADGTVFGGGVYDGHFNVDVVNDTNLIVRPYFFGALHPMPKRVLMIGLASGSWAQVVANLPALEKLTIVEINPGYTELVQGYGPVASLLRNPKVELFVDDGRRWLNRHRDARFDAIVMNTSFVWRAHATSLFSVEFLELLRAHLSEGGMAFYNTGNDPHVQATAVKVFPYSLRVYNHLAVSDRPIEVDRERWERLLRTFRIDGMAVLPSVADERAQRRIARLFARADDVGEPGPDQDPSECCFLETRGSIVRRTAGRELVSDDNMITEWPRLFAGEIDIRRILQRMGGKAVGL